MSLIITGERSQVFYNWLADYQMGTAEVGTCAL